MVETKQCTKCGELKSLSEFSVDRRGKYGRTSRCKTCVAKYSRKYYEKNKERVNVGQRKYYRENKKQIREKHHEWHKANSISVAKRKREDRRANPEKFAERNRRYVENNHDRVAEYHREYYEGNKEKILEYARDWYYKNKEKRTKQIKEYKLANREKFTEYNREYARNRAAEDIQYRLARNLRTRLRSAVKRNYRSGSAVRDLGCSIGELKGHLGKLFNDGMTWDNYGVWHVDHILPLSSFDLTDREQLLKACHYTNLQPLWAEENLRKSNKIQGE